MPDTQYYTIRATIEIDGGSDIKVTGDSIINYSIDTTLCTSGLPIGTAASASFSMELVPPVYASAQKIIPLSNYIKARVVVQLADTENPVESDFKGFGVWYVTGATMSEQNERLTLTGCDVLGLDDGGQLEAEFNGFVDDGIGGNTLAQRLRNACHREQNIMSFDGSKTHVSATEIILSDESARWSYNFPYGVGFQSMEELVDTVEFLRKKTVDKWYKNVRIFDGKTPIMTLRQSIIGYAALAVMGFARINLDGNLEIRVPSWYHAENSTDKNGNVRGDVNYNYTFPARSPSSYIQQKIRSTSYRQLSTCYSLTPDRYVEFEMSATPRFYPRNVIIKNYPNYSVEMSHNEAIHKDNALMYSDNGDAQANNSGYTWTDADRASTVIVDLSPAAGVTLTEYDETSSLDDPNTYAFFDAQRIAASTWLHAPRDENLFYDSGSISFLGLPEFMAGDELDIRAVNEDIYVSSSHGRKYHMIATHVTKRFSGGGLMTEVECNMSGINSSYSQTDYYNINRVGAFSQDTYEDNDYMSASEYDSDGDGIVDRTKAADWAEKADVAARADVLTNDSAYMKLAVYDPDGSGTIKKSLSSYTTEFKAHSFTDMNQFVDAGMYWISLYNTANIPNGILLSGANYAMVCVTNYGTAQRQEIVAHRVDGQTVSFIRSRWTANSWSSSNKWSLVGGCLTIPVNALTDWTITVDYENEIRKHISTFGTGFVNGSYTHPLTFTRTGRTAHISGSVKRNVSGSSLIMSLPRGSVFAPLDNQCEYITVFGSGTKYARIRIAGAGFNGATNPQINIEWYRDIAGGSTNYADQFDWLPINGCYLAREL